MLRKFDKVAFRSAAKAAVPVMAGYLILGMAFGLLMADAGFNFLWAGLMGLIIYGGTMQFVAVDLLANGVPLVSAAMMAFLIQSRHSFYSISMMESYKDYGPLRPYMFFALTDETYALVTLPAQEGVDKRKFDLYLSALNQVFWILGDVIGALVGSFAVFSTQGVDFAMTALFVVIFIEQLSNSTDRVPAIIGTGVALVCLLVFGAENFLLPAMLLMVAGLLVYRKFSPSGVTDG